MSPATNFNQNEISHPKIGIHILALCLYKLAGIFRGHNIELFPQLPVLKTWRRLLGMCGLTGLLL